MHKGSIHFVVVLVINIVALCLTLWRVAVIDNDKGPIIALLVYPLIVIGNLMVAGVLKACKIQSYKFYLTTVKLLLILLIPFIGLLITI